MEKPCRSAARARRHWTGGNERRRATRRSRPDKIMRLHAQTALFENGRVLMPSRAPWLADYVTELTSFPGTRHDDQVDSTTQVLDHLRLKKSMYISPEFVERSRLFRPDFYRRY